MAKDDFKKQQNFKKYPFFRIIKDVHLFNMNILKSTIELFIIILKYS